MREDVQTEVARLWDEATTETIHAIGDLNGYTKDFKNLFLDLDLKQSITIATKNEMVEMEGICYKSIH